MRRGHQMGNATLSEVKALKEQVTTFKESVKLVEVNPEKLHTATQSSVRRHNPKADQECFETLWY